MRFITLFLLGLLAITSCSTLSGCQAQDQQKKTDSDDLQVDQPDLLFDNETILVGAERMHMYLPQIQDKKVGLVINPTSMISSTHLVDTLLSLDIDVIRIFAPEHSYRGTADAGESVKDGIDIKTQLPIISLYGKSKKPLSEHLDGLDVILFDIQDVGARFYTYISTMHYVMEAAAENSLSMIVLDRPNPNGHYVAGPVLDTAFRSFVGMHPVPIVHGMTIGEYAQMINGEAWLKNGIQCDLTVVPCQGYDHTKFYQLPVKPSPNLPNMTSIYLYPALCLFEGTDLSVGRGTNKQFQLLGSPNFKPGEGWLEFTPISMSGAKYPKHEGEQCYGLDFSTIDIRELRTSQLAPDIYISMYSMHQNKALFFTDFFDKLAGGTELRDAISNFKSKEHLHAVYDRGIDEFKLIRKKYLLYTDFE